MKRLNCKYIKLLVAAAMIAGCMLLVACAGTENLQTEETTAQVADETQAETQTETKTEVSEETQTEVVADVQAEAQTDIQAGEPDDKDGDEDHLQIQLLATSDLHGYFLPYDYINNRENLKGSMAQVATAVKELTDDNTILVDVGDAMTGNTSEIYAEMDVNPMVHGFNVLGYDYLVPGNHTFNFGDDYLKKTLEAIEPELLCGNVYDEQGKALGKSHVIIEKDGVKIGIIGMVTPLITVWDADKLGEWTVTDPVEESRKCIDEIKDDVDVIVGLMHMGIGEETSYMTNGVESLAKECPEFDVIIAAHGHEMIDDMVINGVPVIENKDAAQTMGQVLIDMKKENGKWEVDGVDTKLLSMGDVTPNEEFSKEMEPLHEISLANAEKVIGTLDSDFLAAPDEVKGISTAFVEDTALRDIANEAMRYYAQTPVSAMAVGIYDSNLYRGDIRNCDISKIYNYQNNLYKVKMNGEQLKKWMENSARFYNTVKPGDLTVSFNKDIRIYLCDFFSGVNYDVNISKEPGERIENLTWPDGTPVKDDDEFMVAVPDYRYNTNLSRYGHAFKEGDELPELVETNVRSDIGDIQSLIRDYIMNVKGGHITNDCDYNWKLTGYNFDKKYRQRAVELLKSGKLSTEASESGRTSNVRSITINDVKAAEGEN